MVKKSKLLAALDAHKGRDYDAEKRKKQVKAAEKRKKQKQEALQKSGLAEGDVVSTEDVKVATAETKKADDEFASFSDAEKDEDEDTGVKLQNGTSTSIPQPRRSPSVSEAEQESDIPLSDLSEDEREDTIPHQRLTINNGPALLASTKRISVLKPKMSFQAHNSLISSLPPTSTSIPDPNDDLTRELEFYRIARTAAVEARELLAAADIPFTRPNDYFAEMVKSDEHMGKVKKKMYDDAAGKKASSDARQQREAKKFGKQVQQAKEEERSRAKKDMLDKVKDLKRKRKGADTGLVNETDDLFQSISVDDAPKKDRLGRERNADGKPNPKRQKKDAKFGFGGKKRFAKSGDAASSGDMRDFSAGRMKGKNGAAPGGKKRLGKSRRAAGR